MSFFEWIGESYNPGPTGSIENEASKPSKKSRLVVIISFIISMTVIIWISLTFLGDLNYVELERVLVLIAVLLVYCSLGYLLNPKPNYDNVGWFGGMMDNPFRISDDFNRFLIFIKIFLWPGRFITASIVDFIVLIRKRNA